MLKGIDLSAHNGTNLDFNQINDLYDFVICKAGGQEDQAHTYYQHGTFTYHVTGLMNLRKGWYWFNGNKGTAAGGGSYFGDILNAKNISDKDILVLDIEDFSNGSAWTPTQAVAFFNALRAKRPNNPLYAYMNASMERNRDWTPVIELGVKLWIAAYGVNNGLPNTPPTPRYWSEWSIWQYTDKGCNYEPCALIGNSNPGLDLNLAKADAFSSDLRPCTEATHSTVAIGHMVVINNCRYMVKGKTKDTLTLKLQHDFNSDDGSILLAKEPLFRSSTAVTPSSYITGKYWFWDSKEIDGRRRITNMKDRVGKLGQVTGWIRTR